jgi:hypothetical protein
MVKIKSFNLKMSRDLWLFLKEKSAKEDRSMTDIIVKSIEKMKNKNDKKSIDV